MQYLTNIGFFQSGLDPAQDLADIFITAHNANTGNSMNPTQQNVIYNTYNMLLGNGTTNGTDFWNDNLLYRWQCYCPIDDATTNALAYELDLIDPTVLHKFLNGGGMTFDVTGVTITSGLGNGIDSVFNPSTSATVTDYSQGCDFTTGSTTTDNPIGSRGLTNTQYTTMTYFGGNWISNVAATGATLSISRADMPSGLTHQNRSGSTVSMYLNGSLQGSVTSSATSFYNGNIAFQSCNILGTIGGTSSSVDNRKCRGSFIGKSMTANQAQDFYEIWDYFQSNIITGGR